MSTASEFDYKRYLFLLKEGQLLFLTVALAIMTLVCLVSYLLPKKYEASSTVFVEQSVINDLVKGIAITPSVEAKIKVLKTAIQSRTLILQVMKDLDVDLVVKNDVQREELFQKLQLATNVKLDERKGMFEITFTDESPRLARDFVNTLVRRYIEQSTSSKREQSYEANQFLGEQIGIFKGKVEKIEEEINKFKREKGMMLSTDEGTLRKEIDDAQKKLDDLRIKRVEVESARILVKKNDPLQDRLKAARQRLHELRASYTDSYPEVIRAKAEVEALEQQAGNRAPDQIATAADPQAAERLNVELKSITALEQNLQRNMAANRDMLREIPAAKAALDDLMHERNNQKLIYEQLVGRFGQSEVSKQMELQDKAATFRIIDPAVMPVHPVSPKRVKIMLLGIIGGLVGSMGLLILLDMLKKTVKSSDEVRDAGLPVLVVIPKMVPAAVILQQQRTSRKRYVFAAAYFFCIMTVLLMEAAGLPYLDVFFDQINPHHYLLQAKGLVKQIWS